MYIYIYITLHCAMLGRAVHSATGKSAHTHIHTLCSGEKNACYPGDHTPTHPHLIPGYLPYIVVIHVILTWMVSFFFFLTHLVTRRLSLAAVCFSLLQILKVCHL